MRVVNVRGMTPNDPSVVYCGREFGGWKESPLRNRHRTHRTCKVVRCCRFSRHGPVHTQDEAIQLFREDLWALIQKRDPQIMAALAALREDSVLGCWCKPKPCHADVVARAWQWCNANGLLRPPSWSGSCSDFGECWSCNDEGVVLVGPTNGRYEKHFCTHCSHGEQARAAAAG